MNIDLNEYGTFRMGLTNEEIKIYLRQRAKGTKFSKYSTIALEKKFNKIAGINTVSAYICPKCNKTTLLMFRCDVERFANNLFLNADTYWD